MFTRSLHKGFRVAVLNTFCLNVRPTRRSRCPYVGMEAWGPSGTVYSVPRVSALRPLTAEIQCVSPMDL
jgi:hypothetical protein